MATYNDVFEAAEKGTVEDVKYFIEQQGIDVNASSSTGHTVIEFAWLSDNFEVIKYLASKGSNIEPYRIIDAAGMKRNSVETIQFLLDKGFDVNYRDSGMFPLLIAAGTNNIEAAKFLLSKGADLNMESSATGLTALQNAEEHGFTEMVNFLSTQGKGSIGFGILSFLIPLIGLILYLVWKRNKPQKAKSCGIGALIGIVISLIFYFL